MRILAAATLSFEAFVAFFFGLVAMGLHVSYGWPVAAPLAIGCLLVAGLLRFGWAYWAGWAIQGAMIAAGLMVPAMFALGAVFLAIWWAALHFGGKVDTVKAARLAAAGGQAETGSRDPRADLTTS
jgi:hypothetical protein